MSVDRYPNWLALQGVTRRGFMGRAAMLGVSATLAQVLAGKAAFAQEAPKKGGDLRIGIDGAESTNSLDPASYLSTYIQTVGFLWGNCLVELDEQVQPIPELAESWEPNADATQWIFKLRKGVPFHNGKEMTAADVVYSIDHHRNEESQSGALEYLKPVSGVKATGTHEVTVTLNAPNADLPYILADYHLLIMPEGAPYDSAIGTGPYIIEAFEPGVRTFARRNPNYWKEGRAHVDTVEMVAINDPTARSSALQSGGLHLINRVDPKTVSFFDGAADIEIINVPGAGHYLFAMRCDTAPFDNLDLRLALKFGIDRQDIIDRVLGGFGKVGNDHPIPEFDPFYAADLPQHEFDPDRARHHLQKSGVDGPITLYISDAAFSGATDAAVIYRQHAAKAGLDIAVERVPQDGYWSDVWLKRPFYGSYWGGRPTVDLMLSVAYKSDAAWNEAYWKREDFDQTLFAARGELDFGKRKAMYHDLQEMIWHDGGAIIPVFNNYLFAKQSGLEGFVQTPVLTGLRLVEQVYFS